MSITNINTYVSVNSDEHDKELPVEVIVEGCSAWLERSEAAALIVAVQNALGNTPVDTGLAALEARVAALETEACADRKIAQREAFARALNDVPPKQQMIPDTDTSAEEVIATAIEQGLEVTFEYKGENDFAARTRYLEPSGLNTQADWPYVEGLDVYEDDYRRFRLDRIQGPVLFS